MSLLGVVFHVGCAFLFYELLKPVSRRLSFFAMLVLLMATAVQALMAAFYLGPSLVLDTGKSMSAFSTEIERAGVHVPEAKWVCIQHASVSFWALVLPGALLIYRSIFLPRILGVLLAISGVGWMMYLVPPLANRLFMPYIAAASALGEIPLEFWLLVMAVNAQRWKDQTLAVRSSDAHEP